jgi:hypothetical protein
MNPTEVIASMSAAIGLAKELVGINKAVDEATWKLKTAELTSALADAKMGVTERRRLLYPTHRFGKGWKTLMLPSVQSRLRPSV